MITEHILTHEQSLAVKKLGFNEICLGYYNTDPYLKKPMFNMVKPFEHEWCLPAPLKSQFFKWVRENHRIYHDVTFRSVSGKWEYSLGECSSGFLCGGAYNYNTYEESELACIDRIIEIIKNK